MKGDTWGQKPLQKVSFLPNGIRVFGTYDGFDEKIYVAFKGNAFVGHLRFHVSQHPGDENYVLSTSLLGKEFREPRQNEGDREVSYSPYMEKPLATFLSVLGSVPEGLP